MLRQSGIVVVVVVRRRFGRPVPLRNCSGGAGSYHPREIVPRDVWLCRRGGDGWGVPRLESRNSVQDPIAVASKARSVILPSLG